VPFSSTTFLPSAYQNADSQREQKEVSGKLLRVGGRGRRAVQVASYC
jgi:hypothetical protein